MRSVIWSLPATFDLDRIGEWLDENRTAAASAQALYDIGQRTLFLQNFPHGGRPYKDGKRVLIVTGTPYVIEYRLNEGDVEIVRVHHERENWQTAV